MIKYEPGMAIAIPTPCRILPKKKMKNPWAEKQKKLPMENIKMNSAKILFS
jgi:hypothetical protein